MNFDSLYSDVQWIEVRDVGNVKAIKSITEPTKHGYFKRADKIEGPSIANECIASKLAGLLGIPAAEIQLHTLNGSEGYISHADERAETWSAFPDKPTARDHLKDPAVFSKIFVFDFWIRHVDRHDGNLAFVRDKVTDKYNIYIIDNEHCLCGVGQNAPNKTEIDEFVDVFRMQNHVELVRRDEIDEFIRGILDIDNDDIINIVGAFHAKCPELLTSEQAEYLKSFLLNRKEKLQEEINKLYESGRIK